MRIVRSAPSRGLYAVMALVLLASASVTAVMRAGLSVWRGSTGQHAIAIAPDRLLRPGQAVVTVPVAPVHRASQPPTVATAPSHAAVQVATPTTSVPPQSHTTTPATTNKPTSRSTTSTTAPQVPTLPAVRTLVRATLQHVGHPALTVTPAQPISVRGLVETMVSEHVVALQQLADSYLPQPETSTQAWLASSWGWRHL